VSRTQVGVHWPENFEIRRPGIADYPALREFLTGLSPRARYLRFFSGAPPSSQAMLRILAGGSASADALVATGNDVIIGHAMAADRTGPDGTRLTEIGVVVADAYRGQGMGSVLVRELIARAQARGATAVVMEVLAENRQVITMIEDHWPVARRDRSGAYITITARLQPEVLARPGPRTWRPGSEQQPWPAGSREEPWRPASQEGWRSERLAGTR
jgi:ribosomal protein S18 acetylase RimI-like enzyme